MKKTFVTIVMHAENLELRKDPGQIPYHMHKIYGYTSTLVTYFYTLQKERNEAPRTIAPVDPDVIAENYPYLKDEVPGLNLHFLNNEGRHKFYEKAVSDYLENNARSIDVLNLIHFTAENIYYIFLYKRKNPNGKVYLKLDIDINYYRSKKHFFNTNFRLSFFKIFLVQNIIYPRFFSKVDVISAESEAGLSYFKKRFKVPAKKMLLLPNGVDEDRLITITGGAQQYDAKQNVLITVGRIGCRQKNNEMLLKAIADIDLDDWKVYFVGSVEASFNDVIDEFYIKYPTYREKVFFTGRINNTSELYEYYNNAKVFCLTSLDEGFPLSACEAAFFGNYLVLTNAVYCFDELTEYGRYGNSIPVNDLDALKTCLKDLINSNEMLEERCEGIKKYALRNLTWQAILPPLEKVLL